MLTADTAFPSWWTREKLRNTQTLVLDVCVPLPQKPYCIATDRFYTSVDTAKKLLEKWLYMYGAVLTNRGINKELEKTETTAFERWRMAMVNGTSTSAKLCVARHNTEWCLVSLNMSWWSQIWRGSTLMKARQCVSTSCCNWLQQVHGWLRPSQFSACFLQHIFDTQDALVHVTFLHGIDVLLVSALIYYNAIHSTTQLTHKAFRLRVIQLLHVPSTVNAQWQKMSVVLANAEILTPWGLSASFRDHTSSLSLQRVNACVFGAIATPRNAVRHHIIVHCVSLHYMLIVFCLIIRPQTL